VYSVQTNPSSPAVQSASSHYTDKPIPLKQLERAVLSTLGNGRLDLKTYFNPINLPLKAVSQLRKSFAGLSPWRSSFNTRPVHVEFVVDNVDVGQAFLLVLQFLPLSFIPPMLHTYSFICHQCYIILATDSTPEREFATDLKS
jgi:hypothetical protein